MTTQALSSSGTARRVRPADRRDQILAAAAKLFAEYGFEATSVRQIAEAVMILPGSLYHHFDTKEDMLHAVMQQPLARIIATHQADRYAGLDAEESLVASVVERFRNAVDHWEVHMILVNDGAYFRRNPDFAYVQEAKSQSFKLQESILIAGMRAGLFRADLDVYMMIGTVARMLASAADWFRSHDWFSAEDDADYSFDRVVSFHVDCVLRLVRAADRLTAPVSLDLSRSGLDIGLQLNK
jgi:TetR/AcrR family transcriptional regulator, cholesterol catabolism regulator